MENLLVAENIRSFHPEAGPVSLAIAPGNCCYLQSSENSCNTLFEILTGLKRPDEGCVTILGQNLYTLHDTERAAFRRDSVGAVPRGGGFLPELTLLEQVRLPMVLAGLSEDEIVSAKMLLTICPCMISTIRQRGAHPGPWRLHRCSVPV